MLAQDTVSFVTSILGGAITLSSTQWLFSVIRYRFDLLLGWRKKKQVVVVVALAARHVAGIGLVFSTGIQHLAIFLLLVVLVSNLLVYRLMKSHFTAVFRMTHLLAGVLLFAHSSNPEMQNMALTVIACLCVLSYLVAGITKLFAPDWRSGLMLQDFLGSRVNGCRLLYHWLDQRPGWRVLISWSVILFETVSPFLILTGPLGAILFCFLAGLFHTGIAFTMGMNLFPLTWAATYPAVYYFSTHMETVFRIPDNPTPMMFLLMIWFAAMVVWQLVGWVPWIRKLRSSSFYFQMFEFYLYNKRFPNPGIRYRRDTGDIQSREIWKDLPFYNQRRLIHGIWNPQHDLKKAIRQVAFRMKSGKSAENPSFHFTDWILLMKYYPDRTKFEFRVVDEESLQID